MKSIPFLLATTAIAALSASAAHAQLSPTDQARALELSTQLFQQQQQIDALRERQNTLELNLRSQQNLATLQAQAQQSPVNPSLITVTPPIYDIYGRQLPVARPRPATPGTTQPALPASTPTDPAKTSDGAPLYPAGPTDPAVTRPSS